MKCLVNVIILLFTITGFSQEGPKVVVFNSSTNEQKSVDKFNLFKISVLEPFSGDISFYYERILNQNISAEIGLGFTTTDYVNIFLEDAFDESYDDRTSLIGTSFAAGIRYYPYLAGDEFYIAPEFKYRYYHNTYEPTSFGSSPAQSYKEAKSMTNLRVTIGYVYMFDSRIFIDYYASVGIAFIKKSFYEATYDDNTGLYGYELNESRTPRPRISLGIKFGLNF